MPRDPQGNRKKLGAGLDITRQRASCRMHNTYVYEYIYIHMVFYTYSCVYIRIRIRIRIRICICIFTCSPPLRHAKMHFLVPRYPQSHKATDPEIPKIQNPNPQKSKYPNIQISKNLKSKNPKIFARFRRCEKFWNFGVLDF